MPDEDNEFHEEQRRAPPNLRLRRLRPTDLAPGLLRDMDEASARNAPECAADRRQAFRDSLMDWE